MELKSWGKKLLSVAPAAAASAWLVLSGADEKKIATLKNAPSAIPSQNAKEAQGQPLPLRIVIEATREKTKDALKTESALPPLPETVSPSTPASAPPLEKPPSDEELMEKILSKVKSEAEFGPTWALDEDFRALQEHLNPGQLYPFFIKLFETLKNNSEMKFPRSGDENFLRSLAIQISKLCRDPRYLEAFTQALDWMFDKKMRASSGNGEIDYWSTGEKLQELVMTDVVINFKNGKGFLENARKKSAQGNPFPPSEIAEAREGMRNDIRRLEKLGYNRLYLGQLQKDFDSLGI